MSYDSKYKGAEAEALLDKVNEDYEVKSYADYADYNTDTSRVNKTISFVEQDNSIWVQGKQYSMNAGCYVGSDKADVSTTAWYLAGTLNVAAIGWDIQCLGYCTNSLLSEGGGLFVLNLRFNSATDIQIKKFAWLVKTGSTPNLRLVVSEGKVRLYVFVAGGQYRGANIRILTESTSAKRDVTFGARNFFGLSDNTTPETTDPVGTDISDVPYLLKSGNAASATKATQDGNGVVIAGNYQRVYKSSFHVTADGWYKLAYRPRITGGLLDWKDKYILVDVLSRQGGSCHASFKILYSSHAGWLATANNEFMCIPLTATNYACISNVRLLSKDTSVSGNSYIELYVQLSKGGVNASTDVEISIESNISNTYLYNTATAGETDTSAYTVITRNAATSAYGGSLAVGGLIAEKSLSANKLATPRKIGFADFDGTADVSLSKIQSASNTRWSSTSTLKPNQWIRLIRMKFIQTWSSVSITLAIEEYEQQRFRGIINFSAWVGDNLTPSVYNIRALWYSLYQVDRNSFDVTQYIRMIPIAPTDNDTNGYVDVYVMSPLGAISYGWHIINDRRVNNASFTLKADVTTIIDNENFPTSYKSSAFQGVLATGEDIEYDTWVTKATTAETADVANKTKYPLIVASGDTQFNWYADSILKITIPEEMLASAANGVFVMKVPEIEKAKSVTNNDLSNTTELTLPAIHSVTDGMSLGQSPIKLNVGENSLNVNISGKSATSGTADVANKTKYPLILRQDGTNVVSWYANSTVILDVPSEMIESATSGGITLKVPRTPRVHTVTATGQTTNLTGGCGINLVSHDTLNGEAPQDGDTLMLWVKTNIANNTQYPFAICRSATYTFANSDYLYRGTSSGNGVKWQTTNITAGFYTFIYRSDVGGWVLTSSNTLTAP